MPDRPAAPRASISRLDAGTLRARIDEVAEILVDCVNGGASVGFVPPFELEAAREFFGGAIDDVERGGRLLFAAADAGGRLAGTVQLIFANYPNQRHRADVAKLLVHRRARGAGLGRALMRALEAEVLARGRWLLVLDTKSGDRAERLYRSLGWTFSGSIPRFALEGDGGFCATSFYWKQLGAAR
jgi:GNAT superfamily N-acetyltransferase